MQPYKPISVRPVSVVVVEGAECSQRSRKVCEAAGRRVGSIEVVSEAGWRVR